MTQHWASCSIVVCSLLALPTLLSARPAPRAVDPCKQLQRNLDWQIDDAKDRQKDDLENCQLNHGRNSDECRGLKEQQKQELRDLRADRSGQMTGCKNGVVWNTRTGLAQETHDQYAAQYNQYAQENDYYKHHHHHHHHPYPHDTSKPASSVAGKTDKPPDKHATKEATHTEHSAASQTSGHSASHGSASASTQSNSGHTNSGHGGSASSGSSYSGGGHSGGGGASYSGSSSSGGSSHSSGGGGSYSGSSYSGSSYSGGSSSSAPAASAGGGHPK